MAQINISNTGTSGIETPQSGVVAIFSNSADSGKLYYRFSDGSISPVDTGGGGGGSGTSGTSGNTGANGSSGTSGTGTSGTSGGGGGGAGTSGTSGADGTSGTGVTGTSGTSGDGTSGTTGAAGADGTSGTGITGTSGTSGDGTSGTSAPGLTSGTSGANGSSGTSGAAGGAGDDGTSGTSGVAGANGDRYQSTSGSTFTLGGSGTLTIATGLNWSVAQQALIAVNGANYQISEVTAYNSATGLLTFNAPTVLSGSGTYSAFDVNLAGATGGEGTSGTSGDDGTSGTSAPGLTSGTSGANGSSGTSGAQGDAGSSGTSGIGTSGTSGPAGTSGTGGVGTSGTSGSGSSGTSGSAGTSGATGNDGTSGTSGSGGGGGGGKAYAFRVDYTAASIPDGSGANTGQITDGGYTTDSMNITVNSITNVVFDFPSESQPPTSVTGYFYNAPNDTYAVTTFGLGSNNYNLGQGFTSTIASNQASNNFFSAFSTDSEYKFDLTPANYGGVRLGGFTPVNIHCVLVFSFV